MATELAVPQNGTTDIAMPLDEAIEQALIGGDLKGLSPGQRVDLYKRVCGSLGLNPLTQPFEYLHLNGKLVLYAKRNCTDQLRATRGVTVQITGRDKHEDVYVVTARATLPNGRADESIGAVPIAQLKGEPLANALMKAETKAKRRVTLSIVGLSFIDESEVDSIPGARRVSVDEAHAEAAPARAHGPEPVKANAAPAWLDEEDDDGPVTAREERLQMVLDYYAEADDDAALKLATAKAAELRDLLDDAQKEQVRSAAKMAAARIKAWQPA